MAHDGHTNNDENSLSTCDSFIPSAIRQWNTLDPSLRNKDSIAKFKTELRKRKNISQVPKHDEIDHIYLYDALPDETPVITLSVFITSKCDDSICKLTSLAFCFLVDNPASGF
jgi:hypothetical protein